MLKTMIWTDAIYSSTILPTTMIEPSTSMLTKEYHQEDDVIVEEKKRNKKTQSMKTNHPFYDDEKRKKVLERNRQAALKCRQRKKQWLNDLQAKLEYLTNDNEHLQIQCNLMREELIQLRNILWSHKECSHPTMTSLFQPTDTFYSHNYYSTTTTTPTDTLPPPLNNNTPMNHKNVINNISSSSSLSSSSSSSPSSIASPRFQLFH
ncbi:unnamed protein product [Cunninghamella blakesleeana]